MDRHRSTHVRLEPAELTAEGVHLRAWELKDADAVSIARRHPEIVRWSPETMRPPSVEAWIERHMDWSTGTQASFAVVDGGSGAVAGGVRLYDIDRHARVAQVGYWTMPAMSGRGIARRAVAAVTGWAFAELQLGWIELGHAIENVASCRVATAVGYRLQAHLTASYLYGDGRLHDEHLHVRRSSDA